MEGLVPEGVLESPGCPLPQNESKRCTSTREGDRRRKCGHRPDTAPDGGACAWIPRSGGFARHSRQSRHSAAPGVGGGPERTRRGPQTRATGAPWSECRVHTHADSQAVGGGHAASGAARMGLGVQGPFGPRPWGGYTQPAPADPACPPLSPPPGPPSLSAPSCSPHFSGEQPGPAAELRLLPLLTAWGEWVQSPPREAAFYPKRAWAQESCEAAPSGLGWYLAVAALNPQDRGLKRFVQETKGVCLSVSQRRGQPGAELASGSGLPCTPSLAAGTLCVHSRIRSS